MMKKFKVGLQLYSIRQDMEKDMDAALKQVKEMGYDYVEFAGYFGKSAEEVKALLDKHGLTCISVHQAPSLFEEQGQQAVDFLKTIGAKYSAVPWYEAAKLKEDLSGIVDGFLKVSELLKKNGISMLYHNHDFEFEKIDGKTIIDTIYEKAPKGALDPEFDTCWVRYAGYSPEEYIKTYADRIEVLHLKDFVCKKLANGPAYELIDENGKPMAAGSKEDNGFEFRPVGYGMQDFKSILEAASNSNVEYVIVEQDQPSEGRTQMEACKLSREYLKSLGL